MFWQQCCIFYWFVNFFLLTQMLFYKQDESKNRLTLRHFINLPAGDLRSEPKYIFLKVSQNENHVTAIEKTSLTQMSLKQNYVLATVLYFLLVRAFFLLRRLLILKPTSENRLKSSSISRRPHLASFFELSRNFTPDTKFILPWRGNVGNYVLSAL